MNRRLSDIFVITVALALFIDAVNIDDICLSHGMVREEYQGQSTEGYFSSDIEQVVVFALTTTQKITYQQSNNDNNPIYLIDEDSPSLPAHPTITQEIIKFLGRNLCENLMVTHIQTFNFHSLCKLQI
jgi:hypothetical protein